MQRDYGEQPPPDYFEIVSSTQTATGAGNSHSDTPITREETGSRDTTAERATNHDETPAAVDIISQLHNLIQDTIRYLRHPSRFEGVQNGPNSIKGFLDVMSEQKRLPFGFTKIIVYKLLLFVYYLTNFIYSVVAVSIQGDHIVHYTLYLLISLTGLLFEVIVIIVDIQEGLSQNRSTQTARQPREAWSAVQQNYHYKAKGVFVDYVISSLGEFLIYPILICTLYGFINERAWRFDNGVSGCNVVFFLYSVIMDIVFTKLQVIWLVIRIIRATHLKHGEPCDCKRYFNPVYLTVPFAILTALTHWIMIGIIGVRIYVNNFTVDQFTDYSIPNTGDYTVTLFTGYMIGFSLCLPVISPAVYILLNKLWFYEVYTIIHHKMTSTAQRDSTSPQLSWNMKLFAFARDPLAYVTVINLMVLFTIFVVGTYLLDYNSSDYEVSESARNTVQGLGPCFIIFFLISNLQAAVIFTIAGLTVVAMLLCMLCAVCACLCTHHGE